MKPIRPDEVTQTKCERIPDLVIESVNECIIRNWNENSSRSSFTQNEIIKEIQLKYKEAGTPIQRQEIFDSKYLDFEPIFRKIGWKVEYDKPAYCESYEPSFIFTKKKQKRANHEIL